MCPSNLLTNGSEILWELIKNEAIKSKIDEEENLTQLDNINTLYVATTRAKEQLYMIAEKPKESSKTVSIVNYLFE